VRLVVGPLAVKWPWSINIFMSLPQLPNGIFRTQRSRSAKPGMPANVSVLTLRSICRIRQRTLGSWATVREQRNEMVPT
jgi:hypothetical protein